MRGTLEERFWAKVDKNGPNGCWVWTASITSMGYGKVKHNQKDKAAHRVAYELLVGNIQPGMELDHICHKRDCVNPAHLRVCTRSENARNRGADRDSASGIKGISRNHGKWNAQIWADGHRLYLGTFLTPEAAHEAYCKAAERLHGEFANFG